MALILLHGLSQEIKIMKVKCFSKYPNRYFAKYIIQFKRLQPYFNSLLQKKSIKRTSEIELNDKIAINDKKKQLTPFN